MRAQTDVQAPAVLIVAPDMLAAGSLLEGVLTEGRVGTCRWDLREKVRRGTSSGGIRCRMRQRRMTRRWK